MVWKGPLLPHLFLSVFDVIDEFVGFLKNLPFVFAREVVKPRITEHLEDRRRAEGASERADAGV